MKNKKDNNDNKTNTPLIIAVLLFVMSMAAPWIFTHYALWDWADFSETGPIGDTIGGIMGPFIGLGTAILMYLAFNQQLKANGLLKDDLEQQKNEANKDRFENQFFEMLRYHRENTTLARDAASSIKETSMYGGDPPMPYWEQMAGHKAVPRKNDFEHLAHIIKRAYKSSISHPLKENDTEYDLFCKVYRAYWHSDFGHYFRHLFLLIKFIDSKVKNGDDDDDTKDKFLTRPQARFYLRIVRASLSTHEQIILYYNWLSTLGEKWECSDNHFFTDYRMIHNIDPNLLISDYIPIEIHKNTPSGVPDFVRNFANRCCETSGQYYMEGNHDKALFEHERGMTGLDR